MTVFYTGLIKVAPGTFGSLAALVLGAIIIKFLGLGVLSSLSVLAFIVGVFEIDKYQKQTNKQDPKEVVIDELVGMWIAMSMVPFGVLELVLAFLFFRGFDIYKPSIIGKIDKKMKNGLGVMLDDFLAGIFAGLLALLVLKIKTSLGF